MYLSFLKLNVIIRLILALIPLPKTKNLITNSNINNNPTILKCSQTQHMAIQTKMSTEKSRRIVATIKRVAWWIVINLNRTSWDRELPYTGILPPLKSSTRLHIYKLKQMMKIKKGIKQAATCWIWFQTNWTIRIYIGANPFKMRFKIMAIFLIKSLQPVKLQYKIAMKHRYTRSIHILSH